MMMKNKKFWILPLLSAGLLLATACSGAASSSAASSKSASSSSASAPASSESASAPAERTANIYRGEVVSVGENEFTLAQLPGYNYGQAEILFLTDEQTEFTLGDDASSQSEEALPFAEGAFVEVEYDGKLTRSLPPQAVALRVQVIAPHSEGIIVSGTVQMAEKTADGYRIELLPLGAETSSSPADTGSLVVLNLPADALENLSEAELIEGAEVSAVTMGIATASLPPQMPTLALLPYTG